MTLSYSYTPDVWPAIVTFGLVVFLGQYSWRRRHIAGARPFAIACFLASFWTVGVILEISALGAPTQIFWHKFQAIWLMPSAAMITCFILQFAGLDRWLSLRTYALLFLIPALNALAIATNSIHYLVWTGFEMDGHLVPLPGRLFWFFNSYVFVLGLINFAVLVWLALRSPRHRWPVAIIIGAQVVARIGYTLERIEGNWIGPGEAALATFGVVAVSYAVAFLGFHVIDPVTAARRSVLEQMRDGMFVLDLSGRILDVNPMGAAIVGIPKIRLRKQPVSEILPLDSGVPGGSDDAGHVDREITLGNPGPARYYDVNTTPLSDRNGELIGQLLLLHDVTEQKRARARVFDQQEVVATLRERDRLARELHDGIGQVLGYVGMQAETALQWIRKGDSGRAESVLARLADVAREAHSDVRESILNLKADQVQGWSFLQNLERYLEKFQTNYGIQSELSVADGIDDGTFEAAAGVQLLRVFQEALNNSRKHGGASAVRVTVDRNESHARITIADDGHGFDSSRLEGEDGSHFGLTFMRERLLQIGGSLEIDSKPGAGTILSIDVPIRDHVGEGETGESPAG
jgi:signal transduction histidine kinase